MIPRIREYLMSNGIPFKVHHHEPVATFEDAQRLLPFPAEYLVKSLAFQLSHDSIGIAALRAVDRADYRKVSDAFGIKRSELQGAGLEALHEILGMEAGAIAPIPLSGATVVVDHTVESLNAVFCGTGEKTSTLELTGSVFRQFGIGTFAILTKNQAG